MHNDTILLIIQIVVIIGSYLLGRYVLPNISSPAAKETIQDVIAKTDLIINYADKFVSWAKEFKKKSTGTEKMQAVVEQLTYIAEQNGINMTQEQITAIAQKAYDSMKSGIAAAENDKIRAEASQNTAAIIVPTAQIDPAATVDMGTLPPADGTEKVCNPQEVSLF